MYFLYQVIAWSQVFDLHMSVWYIIVQSEMILMFLVLSACGHGYRSEQDIEFTQVSDTGMSGYVSIAFCAILAVLLCYILQLQHGDL
jgi:hypothetical protein